MIRGARHIHPSSSAVILGVSPGLPVLMVTAIIHATVHEVQYKAGMAIDKSSLKLHKPTLLPTQYV